MVPPQFALPRLVALRAVMWCHQCPGDPGGKLELPAILRLPRCEVSGSPAGKLVGAQASTSGSGLVSGCIWSWALAWPAVLFGERSGWGHHRVATWPLEVDGQ
jgi:hypothetical protein